MAQWLIFNRKGNEWKSTKASVMAVYALLDVLKSRGALDKGDRFEIQWGNVADQVSVELWTGLKKPIRWTKQGLDINAASLPCKRPEKGAGDRVRFACVHLFHGQDPGGFRRRMMNVDRKFYKRVKEGDALPPQTFELGNTVSVGDQIEVQLKVQTRSQFEYVHLKRPKAAGFEAEELLSGWKWDQLSRYEEPPRFLTKLLHGLAAARRVTCFGIGYARRPRESTRSEPRSCNRCTPRICRPLRRL